VFRSRAVPYVAPFAVFLGWLGLRQAVQIPELAAQVLCLTVLALVFALVARPVIDLRVRHPAGTLWLGVVVFLLWIGPEYFFPGYRSHWLFSNVVWGSPQPGLSGESQASTLVLTLRTARAALFVPILEELFWRGWLMRWLISRDFESVPLGAWSRGAFWIVAVLFAAEHGPYWDVGLGAGILYNLWMIRTKSLADLMLSHGVTNACLSAYVVWGGHWRYWP
jgi:hypothetical protein